MRKITCWKLPKNSETQFRKIPRHNSRKFRDTNPVISDKTGNQRKRSVRHHADSDRKFRKPILFSKNTVTDESDQKISKLVSGIPKNSETVFIPSRVPPVLVSLLSQALQQATLIVESPDILSRTVHTRSRTYQIISRVQGVPLKAREMRRTIPRAKI
jgi:hypothetical protein